MTTDDRETLTAVLRRLADEHVSGLLAVDVDGQEVLVRLEDGTPTAIGPEHDPGLRVGAHAAPTLQRAAGVQVLVEQLVEGVVRGTATWTWDVDRDATLVTVPTGLPAELSRRAVDAAEAVRAVGDAVLTPTALPAQGEAARRLLPLLDGEVTLADVAATTGIPLTAVATLATGLLASGAAVVAVPEDAAAGAPDDDWAPAPRPAAEATAAATAEATAPATAEAAWPDDLLDEPDMWVMDEEEVAATAPAAPAADTAPVAAPVTTEPATASAAPDAEERPAADAPDDPDAADEPTTPRTSTLISEDESGSWGDTAWLDELEKNDEALWAARRRSQEARSAGQVAAAEFSALVDDGGRDRAGERPPATPPDRPEPTRKATPPRPAPGSSRPTRARTGDVSEFLRELSRLALDEDD